MKVVCDKWWVRVCGWHQTVSTPIEVWRMGLSRKKRWRTTEKRRTLSVVVSNNCDVEVLTSNGHIVGIVWMLGVLMDGPCLPS